uniref:Uncharacterized protein n=1 Tax=Anopheles dirus TaxID=7168 RepID=A0A182NXF2_9DIPT
MNARSCSFQVTNRNRD